MILSVVAAVFYGVVHDQVTVRICPEYFVIAHPPLCEGQTAAVVAACWGVVATWWIGAVMGGILAGVATSAPSPMAIQRIAALLGILLGTMAAAAIVAGGIGFILSPRLRLPVSLVDAISSEAHPRFFTVWFAHIGSYASGIGGGALLIRHVWIQTGRRARLALLPHNVAGWGRAALLLVVLVIVIVAKVR